MKKNITLLILLWTAISAWAGTVPIKLVNNSCFPDNQVYVAIIGQFNGRPIYYDLPRNSNGNAVLGTLTTDLNTLHKTNGDRGFANVFTTLDRIPDRTIHVEHTNACRIFFGFNSPMYLHVNDNNGGYAGADMQNPSDPNHNIRWELVEFTYDNNNVLFINTTRVDAFQYPMGLELYGGQGANNAYMKRGELLSYNEIIDRWKQENGGNVFGKCLQNNVTTDQLGGIIMQPSKVAEVKRSGFFDDYISRIWNAFSAKDILADMGVLGQWQGRVSGNTFNLTALTGEWKGKHAVVNKPSTTDVVEGAGTFAQYNSNDRDLPVQAMFCGAMNRGVINTHLPNGVLQDWGATADFFSIDTFNPYVRFFHQRDLSFDGFTYAFAYDDTFDQSSTCATSNPDHAVITIGGFANSTENGNASSGNQQNKPGADTQGTQPATDYKLVWSDEFDSNTLGRNWNVETVDAPANNEMQAYTSRTENVKIENGTLVITARREKYGSHAFTSGRINSKGKVSFKHGKIVARIKMPVTKRGLWPAFWMMGDDIDNAGWPKCGEIDIMEAGNSGAYANNVEDRYFSGAIHWGERWDQHQYWAPGAVPNAYSVASDYHTFTCTWDEQWIRCYVDDQTEPYFTAAISKVIDQNITSDGYMHKPFHILFNLAVGGDFPAITNAWDITALPDYGSEAKMYVDYVRLYQSEENVIYAENDHGQENLQPAMGAAPVPSLDAGEVSSLYSDSYALAGGTISIGGWGQNTKTEEISLNGNKTLYSQDFNYLGLEQGHEINVTNRHYLHVDIYPTTDFSINICPIGRDAAGNTIDNRKVAVSLKGNQWNQIDIDLNQFTSQGLTLDRLFQIKMDGGNGESFYLDNIYYWSDPTEARITLSRNMEMYSSDRDLDFSNTGLQAYIVSGYVGTTSLSAVLTPVTAVPAGTGLIITGTAGASYKIPFSHVNGIYANLLQAAVQEQTIQPTEGNRTNLLFDNGTFSTFGSPHKVQAGKAYLQLPSNLFVAGAKQVGYIYESETTGINMPAQPTDAHPVKTYDLQGRKMTSARGKLPKGIYIRNGEKFVIR
ncbi:MAG: family 16 glycosylhydrolase [Prevotella sp.]|nr:family 16 glycosylhydrolase [Prevotella sp.]